MKKNIFIISVLNFLVWYLLYAFIKAEINFIKWSEDARSFYVMISVTFLFAILVLFTVINENKQ